MSITTTHAVDESPQGPAPAWTCFVIGPIGDGHTQAGSPEREGFERHVRIFEKVILPACAKFGMDAIRADRITHAGDIHEQICRHVLQDDLVIADVTGGNPNVMYELGLRHVTGKPTIHIGEHGQLPFDIAPIRTIRYDLTLSSLADARTEIEHALEAGMRDGFAILTPARVLRGLQAPGAVPDPSEEPEDENAPGLLDEFAAIEEGLESMTADLEAIAKTIESIGEITERSSQKMEGLSDANAPISARMAAVAQYSDSITTPAKDLDEVAQTFAGRMVTLDSGVRAALALIEMTPPEQRGESSQFLSELMSLAQSARESMSEVSGFGAAAEGIGGMSRYLRGPVRSISSAVKRLASAMACIDEWETTARSLAGGSAPVNYN
ncbi:hypothetical protein [Streptomyces telluris]|uniref:Uncharacterized protein n=1 Tax=Streptomyces telluris TaxID=2720021 RepID=A0A9X2LNF0_9ACTN|nr:hypothetical protein [Streptomyces telluris]MCQ8774067.1 hypothetical protein [Streptomyces telluris]NJP78016.1 hypothetical protein [Streptomyces telluris]